MRNSPKVIEMRIIGLELYIRKALHTLTLYASMDNSASKGLRHLQQFLGVDRKIDCIHPPPMDDQRAIEIMAYQFLNDYNSPACQQCVRFINSVDLEGVVETGEDGYKALLTFLHDALAEVELFVQQQHEQQLLNVLLSRRPDWTVDQRLKLVRLCIRRQVESALYLPLRRTVFRIVQSYVAEKAKKLQRAVALLQHAKPSVFMVDIEITQTTILPKAVKAFRKSILSYLPVDQGQFLVESAKIIVELHTEIREIKQQRAQQQQQQPESPVVRSLSNVSSGGDGPRMAITRIASNTSEANDPTKRPALNRVISNTDTVQSNSSDKSKRSLTGGIFNRKVSGDRRPSLQDKIKDFKEADTCNDTRDSFEDDAENEEENALRVSFAVMQYSSKRKLTSKASKSDPGADVPPPPPSESALTVNSVPSIPEEEGETENGNSGLEKTINSVDISPLPKKMLDPLLSISDEASGKNDSQKSYESRDSSLTPSGRRKSVRPTSLLRKVSNEEMMNDPLLRPLAIELAGTTIDKKYFEEVFDRYSQSFCFPMDPVEEVIRYSSSFFNDFTLF
jgi:hypothetical protein